MTDLIGQDIGRYHIVGQLGEGGMATVYKAFDTRLERDVAIKVIRKDAFPANMHANVFKRFEREAKALARLSHPNIVKIHDYGEFEGSPYLVMEFIPGGTLKSKMGVPFKTDEAVRLLLPIASALAYAHEHDIIHRDVKPANILLSEKGQPVLSDFGIAKILEGEDGTTLTGTGVGIGTPEYMAPEQCLGQEVDSRTDIYSLGIVFYEMVAGRKPFVANTPMAVVHKQISDPLPRPAQFVPGLPEAVEKVIYKVLAKQPEERYASMGEFAAALEKLPARVETLQAPQPVSAETITFPDPVRDRTKAAAPHQRADVTWDANQVPGLSRVEPKRSGIPKLAYLLGGCILLVLLVGGIWLVTKMTALTTPTTVALVPTSISTANVYAFTPTKTVITPTNALEIKAPSISEKDGMKMVVVPAGQFTMGPTEAQIQAAVTYCLFSTNNLQSACQNKFDIETPDHIVYLDTFWIDQTDVTNAMFARCVKAKSCLPPHATKSYVRPDYYGNSQYEDYPVVYVDWNQADAYCKWAGRRLPTEAEWEKAARGTDGRIFPWGELFDKGKGNFYQSIGDTSKVGDYPAGVSPYGALDMAGNVWQWVADWYDETYYRFTPDRNPTGPTSGLYRVIRGGAWDFGDYTIEYIHSFDRKKSDPDTTNYDFGFRCAMGAAP